MLIPARRSTAKNSKTRYEFEHVTKKCLLCPNTDLWNPHREFRYVFFSFVKTTISWSWWHKRKGHRFYYTDSVPTTKFRIATSKCSWDIRRYSFVRAFWAPLSDNLKYSTNSSCLKGNNLRFLDMVKCFLANRCNETAVVSDKNHWQFASNDERGGQLMIAACVHKQDTLPIANNHRHRDDTWYEC